MAASSSMLGSTSAKFLGHAGLDQARRFELRDVLRDVFVLVGRLCPGRESRSQLTYDLDCAARR